MPSTKPAGARKERVVLGMAASLGAFFMFTVMNAFAKLLSENHNAIEIAFYRNLVACLPFLFVIYGLGRREILVIRSKPGLVVTRAVMGAITIAMTFVAYSLMPLADTTAFLFASSLFVPVLGVLLLSEHVGPWRWSAVVIGFAGVVVMVQPSGETYLLGVTVALAAALMQALMQILLRYLGRYESPETVSCYFFLIGTVVMAAPLPFVAVTPTLDELPLLLGIGLSGAAAQFLLSTALRNAPAAIVTVFNYSGIVWATLLGWLIWNDWPLPQVFLGAAIVIACNLLVIWRESRLQKLSGAVVRARL